MEDNTQNNEKKEEKIVWKETPISDEERFADALHALEDLQGLELTNGIDETIKSFDKGLIAYGIHFLGSRAFHRQDHKKTVTFLKEYFRLETPKDERPYYELGSSYLKLRDYKNAEEIIKKYAWNYSFFPDYSGTERFCEIECR